MNPSHSLLLACFHASNFLGRDSCFTSTFFLLSVLSLLTNIHFLFLFTWTHTSWGNGGNGNNNRAGVNIAEMGINIFNRREMASEFAWSTWGTMLQERLETEMNVWSLRLDVCFTFLSHNFVC